MTTAEQQSPPYFRLSLYYVFYFAALGSYVPYWSVYLKGLNFNAVEIGELIGIFMFSKFLAPLIWGWLADHTGQRLKWIRLAAFLSIVGLLPIFIKQSYLWVASVTLLFGFFWNASLPQFEAITLNHLGNKSSRYSRVRLWGSIGFIISSACLPFLFAETGISILPWVLLASFIVLWVSTWFVTDKHHHALEQTSQGIVKVIKHPMVIALLIACILQAVSHGAYYTFFSIYLEEKGYSREFVGWMWALGVLAEVVLFLFAHRLFARYPAYQLFTISLLITAIRWLLLGEFVDNMVILWFSQLLHAASFGLFHASAIHLIHDWFPGRLQGRGQALYAGMSFGLGGAVGSVLSGYLWHFSSSTTTLFIMSAIAFVGWLIAITMIKKSVLWSV